MTIKDKTPLPDIKTLINKTKTHSIFTKFDVRWGYNNVCIREGDEWKAAFKTPQTQTRPAGLWEPTVMFFGLCNSPVTFQRMMNEILLPAQTKVTIYGNSALGNYIDDILISSEEGHIDEHRKIVRQILEILWKHKLYLKPSKCSFEKDEIDWLGFILKKGTVTMDPSKVDTITKWPTPKDKKSLQQFLGFTNFY